MSNNKLNILYTCDNAYLEITSISMSSVIYNNPNVSIDFYIATESPNNEKYNKLINFYKNNKRIKIIYLNCMKYDDLLEKRKLDKWGSNSFYVYWKLFAYNNLDIKQIWYLDSDTICINKIENPELKDNKAIGAVLDSAHACFNKMAHIDENYYFFNTGALFVDINRWKKCECEKKIIDYIKYFEYYPMMCDQDILSISLQSEIEVLDPKYCYFSGYDYYGVENSFKMYSLDKKKFYKIEEIKKARKDTIIYHCLGGVFGRPWEKDNNSPMKDEYLFYRKQSAWPEYEKAKKKTLIFEIEKKLEILPKPIYNKMHNFAIKLYLKKMQKNANSK